MTNVLALTKDVTHGEDLAIEITRSLYSFIAIADVCREHEDAARSTYQELIHKDFNVPDRETSPRRKVRRRLYLVCLALGIDPAHYGLTAEDRATNWPGDAMLAKALERSLAEWAARDSNPEPAG